MKKHYMYIMASKYNGTIYVGVTNDLIRRVYEHKHKIIKGFTAQHDVDKLVYYEEHDSYEQAARREKRLKNWCRQWKINLIMAKNPEWKDLYDIII